MGAAGDQRNWVSLIGSSLSLSVVGGVTFADITVLLIFEPQTGK